MSTLYAGMSLRDIYTRKCDEMHCKKNSAIVALLPTKPDVFDVPVTIDMSQNFVGSKGLMPLLEVVRCCTGLISLDLRDQQMNNECVTAICDVVQRHPTLTILNLSNNPITVEAGRVLIELSKANPRLEEIHLANTGIKSVISSAIAVQLAKNKTAKQNRNADEVPTFAAGSTVSTSSMDQTVVREALRSFPTTVSPLLFDDNIFEPVEKLCLQYNARFIDTQFLPQSSAIQFVGAKEYGVKDWKRVSDFPGAMISPEPNAATEGQEHALPKPSEVDPSFAWVFTALTSTNRLGSMPWCSGLQPSVAVSGCGHYTFRFFIDGKWRFVIVDDYIPVNSEGKPAFVSAISDRYYWPCLLLKAAAKLHGTYQAIDQSVKVRHAAERLATCATTMSDLSGGVGHSRDMHHQEFDADEWWTTLLELHAANSTLVGTTGAADGNIIMSRCGIAGHHAYEILQIRQVNGFRLVRLISRFSDLQWTGDWSSGSNLWEQHPDVAIALDYNFSQARVEKAFWMPYLKFLQTFDAVHICRTSDSNNARIFEGEWNRLTAGGPYFEQSWFTNPRYRITPSSTSRFFVTLSLPDSRFSASEVDALAFHVLRSDVYPLRYDKESLVAKTSYVVTNAVSYEGVISGDGDVWLVPSSYRVGKLGRFFLRVSSDSPFSVTHEPQAKYWTQRTEVLQVEGSGEYQNGEDNPQFALRIPADTHPAKLLVQMVTPESEQLSLALFLCVNPQNRVERLVGSIPEDNVQAKSKFVIGNAVFLDATVVGGDTTFVVVPYVSPENTTAKLQFRFWCSHPKMELTPLPMWRKKVVECEWTRSGGYQDTKGNPQIELVTPIPSQDFAIRVQAIGASDPSIIFFVVNNHGRLGDALEGRIPDEKIVTKSTYIRHSTVVKEFKNGASPKDSYLIVPCLQPPGTKAKCVVTVTSMTEDFQLRLLPSPDQ